jgi:trans-2,3-dihydro-3-hydroxyanthranilate isomerase
MKRRFFTLDVFTQTKFAGNPLAVVLESEELDTAAMQAIAREFNHPETVFVFRPRDANNLAALRIFTPAAELPFAGHPTVGTAVLLAILNGADAPREFVLEEKIGNVPCRFEPKTADTGYVRFTIPSPPAPAGDLPGKKEIAAALSLAPDDIGFDDAAPSRWSAGVPFSFVPLKNLDAAARSHPNPASFEKVFGIGGSAKVYVFSKETAIAGHDFHVRMFAPGAGIPEDPATGAGAAAFAGLLAASGRNGDGEHTIRIEQGYEMGRPSLIELGLIVRGGRLASASVGGNAVIVTEGSIAA